MRLRPDCDHIDEHPLPGLRWALLTMHLQDLEVGHCAPLLVHHVCHCVGGEEGHEHVPPHALHAVVAAPAA
eukprot:11195730-Lingulodinium_polyedra.AAC.1